MKKVSPCCPPVLHSTLGRRVAEELAATLKALADPARLKEVRSALATHAPKQKAAQRR